MNLEKTNFFKMIVPLGKSITIVLLTTVMCLPAKAQNQNLLTGDTRLACEAIICLSSTKEESECMPSLAKYFSINASDWVDTVRDRLNFLNLCPSATEDENMVSLVEAIANGAGRCDAQSLNRELEAWINKGGDTEVHYISNADLQDSKKNKVQ